MSKFRLLLPLLLAIILGGCVSAPQPVPKGYTGPVARINDTWSPVSDTKVHFFELQKIDGREVQASSYSTMERNRGRGFFMEPILETREVPAGAVTLKIAGVTHVAADILAFGGKMYFVSGEVPVTLEAGKTYRVTGVLSKEYSAVWLEDDKGAVVSTKIEKGQKP
jgi:hypothetical protein